MSTSMLKTESMPCHAGELHIVCCRTSRTNPCMYYKPVRKTKGGKRTTRCAYEKCGKCCYSLVRVNLAVLELKKNGVYLVREDEACLTRKK